MPDYRQVRFNENKVKFNDFRVNLHFTNTYTDMSQTFGQWLAELRDDRGLNQTELAKKSKLTKATISLIEGDKIEQPRLAGLDNIAVALGIETGFIRKVYAEKVLGVFSDIPAPLLLSDFRELDASDLLDVKDYAEFLRTKKSMRRDDQERQSFRAKHSDPAGYKVETDEDAVNSIPYVGKLEKKDKTG